MKKFVKFLIYYSSSLLTIFVTIFLVYKTTNRFPFIAAPTILSAGGHGTRKQGIAMFSLEVVATFMSSMFDVGIAHNNKSTNLVKNSLNLG